jgi:hypothetical protein
MFRELLTHPQEALNKRHLVYCVRVMSIGCYQDWSRTGVRDNSLAFFSKWRHELMTSQPSLHKKLNYRKYGRDSVFGMAIRYGLDGPGFESRWGAKFSAPVPPSPYTIGNVCFPGVKRRGVAWRGDDHSQPTSAEVKGGVAPYLRASVACSMVNCTIT